MKIPVRLIGIRNHYNLEYLDTEIIGIRLTEELGYTKLNEEQANKYNLTSRNGENDLYRIHSEVEFIFYNKETVTISRIRIGVDTELYSYYNLEDNKPNVSKIACTILNNQIGTNINIDVLNYNNTFRLLDVNGIEVIVDTENLITIGSFTAPLSVVTHDTDVVLPYSSEITLDEDDDANNRIMDLIDAVGQDYIITVDELKDILKLRFGDITKEEY